MAATHLTLLYLITLVSTLEGQCPTSWPGGVQLGVPEYFYPFDPGVDMMVPEGDDTNSPRLTLGTLFPFYGQFFRYMYVSTNGALYFDDPPEWFPIGGMPLQNIPLIGPLFVDTDASMSDGRVYYRATRDEDILCRFSSYVRTKRLNADNFKATWAFIGTWYKLTFWRGNSSDPVNTFQAVIATDGHDSFALFQYGELNWSIARGIIHSQVGFNSGIGDNHYVIPESGTGTTTRLHTFTGNTRDVGRWLFRIDTEIINGHGSEGLVASLTVEEDKPITLTCPSANLNYIKRFWLRGYFDDSDRKLLFSQTNSTSVTSHYGPRVGISVNPATFELTIAEAWLEDDSYFSCEVLHGNPLRRMFDNVQLNVYIQPEIIMTGLEKTIFTRNTTVTVTCTIPRVYPAIRKGAFQLLWGALGNPNSAVEEYEMIKNRDNSYSYTIRRMRTVTPEDDGRVVTCSVIPENGDQVSISKTLTVTIQANVKVASELSSSKKKMNVAVLAGGIAGGVCFLFIIVVLAFFCTIGRRDRHGHLQSHISRMPSRVNPGYQHHDEGPASSGLSKADRHPIVKEEFYEEILDPAPIKKGGKGRTKPSPTENHDEITVAS